jgi:hypothetical protein
MFVDQVKGQQRMAQVVKDTHEQDEIETLAQSSHVVDRKLAELDLGAGDLGRELGLGQIVGIGVDRDHALGAAPLHRDGVETAIAADVEHRAAGEILGQRVREPLPLHVRIVAEEVVGRGPYAP